MAKRLPDDVVQRILEAVSRPVDYEKLAAEEAARTDPWKWYCRLCGATGSVDHTGDRVADEDVRDAAAFAHLTDTRCGQHGVLGWEKSGRLLHVWTYSRSAVAHYN
jgi:hypothetical protein